MNIFSYSVDETVSSLCGVSPLGCGSFRVSHDLPVRFQFLKSWPGVDYLY